MTSGSIRIGVGGWVFEPWRGTFYPDGLAQKSELAHLGRALTACEINGTYYGTQKRESFARWRDETPDGFVFALKGSRYVTNRRVLAEAGPSIEKFVGSGVAELGPKLGPINWQFATTKAFDPADFEAFLALLPREAEGVALRHAVEVRHPSFRTAEFVALARKHEVGIVLAGDSEFPEIADVTAPFVYARIMGTKPGHPAGYAPKALDLWAQRARQLASGEAPEGMELLADPPKMAAREVFLFVISGEKVLNPAAAQALIERIGR